MSLHRPGTVGKRETRHNRDFVRSYERWFQAIYQDKYEYMGEFDLMRLAFLLDVGLYTMGVASQPFKRGAKAFTEPVFSTTPSVPFFYFIRFYNRRFARIARARRLRDDLGRHNNCKRFLFQGYTFAPTSAFPLVKATAAWAWLELKEGWRSWFRKPSATEKERPLATPQPSLKIDAPASSSITSG